MYSVYLVDDSNLILQSLTESINWVNNGFILLGSNTNPKTALEEICLKKPDVVFCDLKMPDMSGIELIYKCKSAGLSCEYIMLSSFPEFEASRDFFMLGGFDYLLKPINTETIQLTLEKLLEKLLVKLPRLNNEITPEFASSFDNLVAYLNENYSKKHTLKSLSEKFFMSETYICTLFSKKLSTTFSMYIIALRMKKAGELISTANTTMKEIGILCGYSDYFYFCKVFKNFYGMTPSEYKKKSAKISTTEGNI